MPTSPRTDGACDRVRVRGKHLFVGAARLDVRGVTYGPFGAAEREYPPPEQVRDDFARMTALGITAVRVYTVPPRWLLDLALEHGLHVMVGLPWGGHVAFLDEGLEREIEHAVRQGVRRCAGHPAVLCYALGNEIPSSIVRWHGRRRIERFIARLDAAAREEDPGALITYANYPTTEYLHLPFLDVVTFNVFLEEQPAFARYLDRLQNLAGDRPLLLGETGLDSASNGEQQQADALSWQLRSARAIGCAGTFVFAWSDVWERGGAQVDDWSFGLVDRRGVAKPAAHAVAAVYRAEPREEAWPRVSVVVCTYNGARTLAACLDAVAALDYPDFECLVIDDGSTDATAAIAARADCRVISMANHGLAHARNVGLEAATGEIVAYLDDDAAPDPLWLRYLVPCFDDETVAAAGGPNVLPPEQGGVGECVAHAPGGPVHVLLSDREAEHLPGCNLAIRAHALRAVGGFDPRFRIAGDDVDICWRLDAAGGRIVFHPAAVVFHRRRDRVRAYLRQQYQYGRAEALLERKWPERYNAGGHLTWTGRVYAGDAMGRRWARDRIYYGPWGTSPFQFAEQAPLSGLAALPLLPETTLGVAALAALSGLGALWRPLLVVLPLLVLVLAAMVVDCGVAARRAARARGRRAVVAPWRFVALTAALHLLQPPVRLAGRLRHGLRPWRRRSTVRARVPRPRELRDWSDRGAAAQDRLAALAGRVTAMMGAVVHGGARDRWDLELRGGLLGGVRVLMAVEEHGGGRQLVRLRVRPVMARVGVVAAAGLVVLAAVASESGAAVAAATLAGGAIGLLGVELLHCAAAMGLVCQAFVDEPLVRQHENHLLALTLPTLRPAEPLVEHAGLFNGGTAVEASSR